MVAGRWLFVFSDLGYFMAASRTLKLALIMIRLVRLDAGEKHLLSAGRTVRVRDRLFGMNKIGGLHGCLPSIFVCRRESVPALSRRRLVVPLSMMGLACALVGVRVEKKRPRSSDVHSRESYSDRHRDTTYSGRMSNIGPFGPSRRCNAA